MIMDYIWEETSVGQNRESKESLFLSIVFLNLVFDTKLVIFLTFLHLRLIPGTDFTL